MSDQEEMYENLRIAEQIDAWMSGPIGKYVMAQKLESEKKVLEAFRRVDVTNVKKTTDLQRALDACTTGVQWLTDAIRMGIQYDQILRAEKGEHDE